jgi:hypothetical protein
MFNRNVILKGKAIYETELNIFYYGSQIIWKWYFGFSKEI